MSRLLVIGDLHLPFAHPGYFAFCSDLAESWDVDKIHFVGDVVDLHSISFHEHHPELPAPLAECEIAYEALRPWVARFPKATVAIGNHDERIYRKARSAGVPDRFLKDYRTIWGTPGWDWDESFKIDGVHLMHGTGADGIHPAYHASLRLCCSVAIGHVHRCAGVKWVVGPDQRHFGMDVGCGVDDKALAFAYAKHSLRKSVVAAGVIIDGHPYHEIMPLARGEKYHRARFKEKK